MRMEQALDADGCESVRKFLGMLLAAHKRYGKVDVREFMKQYVFWQHGGYSKNRKENMPIFWTKERVKEAKAMRETGMFWKDIGAAFGKPGQSAQCAVARYEGRV